MLGGIQEQTEPLEISEDTKEIEAEDATKYAKIGVSNSEEKRYQSGNMVKVIANISVPVLNVEEKDAAMKREHKGTDTSKKRNNVTFGGWFDDDAFELYDDEWTDEFMNKKRVHYERFVELSEDVNVSSVA